MCNRSSVSICVTILLSSSSSLQATTGQCTEDFAPGKIIFADNCWEDSFDITCPAVGSEAYHFSVGVLIEEASIWGCDAVVQETTEDSLVDEHILSSYVSFSVKRHRADMPGDGRVIHERDDV